MIKCDETKPFIFISYSHRDSEKVIYIINKLMNAGYNVWYDEGIDPGTEWDENIASHVKRCSYFIAFISENYVDSKNCKDELNYSRDLDKEQLLVYLEDVNLPEGMAMRMNRIQAIFWNKYMPQKESEALTKLFSAKGIEVTKIYDVVMDGAKDTYPKLILKPDVTSSQSENKGLAKGFKWYYAAIPAVIILIVAIAIFAMGGGNRMNSNLKTGIEYLRGTDTIKADEDMAIPYLETAANEGDIDAAFILSYIYYSNEEYEKAFKALDACDEENPYAKLRLGEMYIMGNDYLKADEEKGNKLCKEALELIDQNSIKTDSSLIYQAEAAYTLGYMYYYGCGLEDGKPDYVEAKEFFDVAADKGNASAINYLGLIFLDGDKGYKEDKPRAVEYFTEAKNRNNAYGMYNLGLCYENGWGVGEKNDELAFENYMEAAERNHNSAIFKVAYFYQYGRGVEKNYEEAISWYEKLIAKNEDTGAINNLAAIFESRDDGVEKDVKRAMELYKEAADGGNVIAQKNLGVRLLGSFYSDTYNDYRDTASAADYLEKSANNGNNVAKSYLAYCYYNGIGIEENREKAVELATESIDAEVENGTNVEWPAYAVMARAYYYGSGGMTQDTDKAKEYVDTAVKRNCNDDNVLNLSGIYKVNAKDYENAYNDYVLAYEGGNFISGDNIAWLYYNGFYGAKDGEPDYKEAEYWFYDKQYKADNADDVTKARGAYGIGILYEYEKLYTARGEEAKAKAIEWYEVALRLNPEHENAKKGLERLGVTVN